MCSICKICPFRHRPRVRWPVWRSKAAADIFGRGAAVTVTLFRLELHNKPSIVYITWNCACVDRMRRLFRLFFHNLDNILCKWSVCQRMILDFFLLDWKTWMLALNYFAASCVGENISYFLSLLLSDANWVLRCVPPVHGVHLQWSELLYYVFLDISGR